MKHCLVDLYQDCANDCSGVKNGPALRVRGFPCMYIIETSKIFFSETAKARAQIFGIEDFPLDLYKDCSNNCPWIKNGPAPGVT